MERDFIQQDDERFGYHRFDYLYLKDSMTEGERFSMVDTAISSFFEGE